MKNRLYDPRDEHGLERSEGRHFAQISHASLEDFKFIWNNIMAITNDGDGSMLKLRSGEASAM